MVNIQYKLVNHTNTGSNNAIKLLPHLQKEGHSVLESKCPQKKPSSSKLQSISSPSASRWHSILINHLAGSPSLPMLAFWSSELQTLHLSSLSSHAAAAAESLHSCPTLCDTMDCSPPGSSVCGILPARMLEWITMTSSRGSSQLRDQTHVCLLHWQAGRFFATSTTWEARCGYQVNTIVYKILELGCILVLSKEQFLILVE